jgi:hypothetical protein
VQVELEQPPSLRLERPQAGELLGTAVPQLHAVVGVDDDDGELERAEDPLQEAVDPVDLERPVAQLVVERLQLLVGALQLLVHRLELLVGALELLVGRLELLDGALELLVGRLELLARALQLLVGRRQLAVELPEPCPQLVPVRDVLEDEVDALRLAVDRERRDPDVPPAAGAAPGGLHSTSRTSTASPLACTDATDPRSSSGRRDSSSRWNSVPTSVCASPRSRCARSLSRVSVPEASSTSWAAGAATNAASAARRRVASRPWPPTARRASRPAVPDRRGPEDALGEVHRGEQRRLGEQHLGAPQHEQPVLVQREGEALQDLRLRVGREVHQHVAARQEQHRARSGRRAAGRGARR